MDRVSEIRVGDTVRIVDTYEGKVTHAGSVITIANRYSLDMLPLEDIPEGVVRTREWKVLKKAVPDVLPVGTVVSYKGKHAYVQTRDGARNILTGWCRWDKCLLATDVRMGYAEIVYDPCED